MWISGLILISNKYNQGKRTIALETLTNRQNRLTSNKTTIAPKTKLVISPLITAGERETSQWNSSFLSWHHRFGGGGASSTSWRSVGGFEMASDTCTLIVSRRSNSCSIWLTLFVRTGDQNLSEIKDKFSEVLIDWSVRCLCSALNYSHVLTLRCCLKSDSISAVYLFTRLFLKFWLLSNNRQHFDFFEGKWRKVAPRKRRWASSSTK